MVTKSNYTSDGVQAAKSVMLELHRILGEYADHVVVIGGWVPELLISQKAEPHVGSMDVDLAINHWSIPKGGYKTMNISRGNNPLFTTEPLPSAAKK